MADKEIKQLTEETTPETGDFYIMQKVSNDDTVKVDADNVLPVNSVTTAKILDANVTTAKLADGSVTTDKTYVKTVYATWTPSGNSDATSGGFADYGSGTVSVTVPTWATKVIVSTSIFGTYQITSTSETDLKIVFGSVSGVTVHKYSLVASQANDCAWSEELTLSGTGSQTLKVQARRTSGTGAMRTPTNALFSFVITFAAV